jgi:hypothetical protein
MCVREQVRADSSLSGEAKGWVNCCGLKVEAESCSFEEAGQSFLFRSEDGELQVCQRA